jgi:Glyoxalase-like domain
MEANILNIVFSCPGEDEDGPRKLASFYAELLGMRIIREDWLRIATDENGLPRLAFDDPSGDTPPRWPDPEYPQQVHLDVVVPNLEGAEGAVLGIGATRLQDKGDYRSYADPLGHPFCMYRAGAEDDSAAEPLPGRLERVVFDCFSPRALAPFYEGLLGMRTRVQDSQHCVVIGRGDGSLPMLAFQHASIYKAPRWPDPAYPQQIHLDLDVEDGPPAQELAEQLGAIRLPEMGGSCPVYADPSGHPFCLCAPDQ